MMKVTLFLLTLILCCSGAHGVFSGAGRKGGPTLAKKRPVKIDKKRPLKVDKRRPVKIDKKRPVKVDKKHNVKVDKKRTVKVDKKRPSKVNKKRSSKVDTSKKNIFPFASAYSESLNRALEKITSPTTEPWITIASKSASVWGTIESNSASLWGFILTSPGPGEDPYVMVGLRYVLIFTFFCVAALAVLDSLSQVSSVFGGVLTETIVVK